MEAYVTEEQQIEAIKKWFKKYGNTVFWIITLIFLAIAGFKYWFHHQDVIKTQASDHYFTLLTAVAQNDALTVQTQGELLIAQFPRSSYATFAALQLAKEATHKKEFDKACDHLKWAIAHTKETELNALARVRLIKLLYAQNQLEEAKSFLDEKKAGGYLTLMAELKGDILVKQNALKEAADAYEIALLSAPEEGMHGPWLKMKLEDLGVDPQKLIEDQAKANEAKK